MLLQVREIQRTHSRNHCQDAKSANGQNMLVRDGCSNRDNNNNNNMNFPVSQNMEAYAGRVRDIPLERVQHHSFVRPKRVFVDDFLSLHKASKAYTGKVFTVNLRHHRDDQALSDCVGFIRSLDEHNMPRLGDVMVPPPQINKVSWFDRKPQAAADEPLYRFHQRYSGRSGRSELKR